MATGKQPDTTLLTQLIEVIAMQNDVRTMKQYYSQDAGEKLMRLRQPYSDAQPMRLSESWKKLFREAQSILGEDSSERPGSGILQSLV